MLGDKVGVHLHVGEALGVSLEVNLEVPLGGESVSAHITFVGTFTSVRSEMNICL